MAQSFPYTHRLRLDLHQMPPAFGPPVKPMWSDNLVREVPGLRPALDALAIETVGRVLTQSRNCHVIRLLSATHIPFIDREALKAIGDEG
jgi:hypothetical protein